MSNIPVIFDESEFEILGQAETSGRMPGEMIIVLGSAGAGKTTFLDSVNTDTNNGLLLIDTEERAERFAMRRIVLPRAAIEATTPKERLRKLNNWMKEVINRVANNQAPYQDVKVVAIDSFTAYYEYVSKLYLEVMGITSMQIQHYNKLYEANWAVVNYAYKVLRDKGISIAYICHMSKTTEKSPDGTEYTTYEPTLNPGFKTGFMHKADINLYAIPAAPGEPYNRFASNSQGGKYSHAKDGTGRLPTTLPMRWAAIEACWTGGEPEDYQPTIQIKQAKSNKKAAGK